MLHSVQIYKSLAPWHSSGMERTSEGQGGLRERKRRETLRRITETGLELFIANGYEATTLDAIAEASGIARRTFFHYFKSKEEILLAWQGGMPDAVRDAILAGPVAPTPLEAMRGALTRLAENFRSERAVSIDRIVRSTEHLRAGNQAKFLNIEQAAFEALCQIWPAPERREGLRLVAMVAVGTMRLSLDAWAEEGGRKPLSEYLDATFARLDAELRQVAGAWATYG